VRKVAPDGTEQPRRLKFGGNFFAFISAQVLIGVVAFVLVSDYMADGYIKHAVLNVFNSGAGDGRDSKIDPEMTIVVKPPAAQGEISNQEIAAQNLPAPIEPVETPSAEIQKPILSAEPTPQAERQVAVPVVELETAPKAEEQVVAVAPIPDLTPLTDAPAAPLPSQPTTPPQTDGQPLRDCATCPELVGVAPGRFVMGAGSEGLGQQVSVTTAQDVAIAAPFAIGRYEITFDEWSQCVGDGGCTSQPADENWGRGRRPVINVSFNDITQQYLPWLSSKTGFTYRLPTEAEWEFAARGGGAAPAGQAYSFGDDTELLCGYGNSSDLAARTTDANWTGINCNDGYATTAPAGSLKPNGLGLFDMHGNVWEWTADCWQPQYSAKPAKPDEACNSRVMRGGSWASAAPALRSAARGWERQDKSKNSIGFRVARQQP
jgi:formylglycine-generating enzyme required for sulfatase activity